MTCGLIGVMLGMGGSAGKTGKESEPETDRSKLWSLSDEGMKGRLGSDETDAGRGEGGGVLGESNIGEELEKFEFGKAFEFEPSLGGIGGVELGERE